MLASLFKHHQSNGKTVPGRFLNGNDHLIELRNVSKIYANAAGEFPALKAVNLLVDEGEFVAVIGKSGSGKSTLINMITAIDRPTSGEVLVGDTAINMLNEGALAGWRGRTIGIIFQFFQLLPTLTVIENVMLPMDFCHMYARNERKERALQLLAQVDMEEHAYKLPSAVSGGQQQRVAIARALANDPPILIADEPTGNLDSKTAESVFRLFESQVNEGKTILMVTHDHDLAERATRTVMITDGEIIEEHLARVFPVLSEKQLIAATHGTRPKRFAPGSIILSEGMQADNLYIITKGEVDILLSCNGGQEIKSDTLRKGQFFGEIELLNGGENRATVRAGSPEGVEVTILEGATFRNLMAESAQARASIDTIVQERLHENEVNRRRGDYA